MTKSELRQIIREEISKISKSSRINEIQEPFKTWFYISKDMPYDPKSPGHQQLASQLGTKWVSYDTFKSEDNQRRVELMKDKFGILFGGNIKHLPDDQQAFMLRTDTEEKNDLIKFLTKKGIPYETRMGKNNSTMVVIPIEYSDMK